MATKTVLRTIAGIVDVRAALDNSRPGRTLSIGNNWNKLRIATRLIVNGAASITGTPVFAMGVCSGTTNRWDNGSAPTDHFVGASTSNSTWNLSSDIYFVNSGTLDWRPTKRVGTTLTYGTQMNVILFPTLTLNRRWLLFLDINKGSPNFTLKSFQGDSAAADISHETFLAVAGIETAALANHAFGTAQTLAVDESSNGNLDSICFGWDRTVQKIELCDVAVVRFA